MATRRSRRAQQPTGFWGWIAQVLSQFQEAMRGSSGPWHGP
jgi:hypothetical protein